MSLCAWVEEPAQAQIWTGARTAGPNTFVFGAFGDFIFIPSAEFMGVGVIEYGIGSKFDLEARFGAGTMPLYGAIFGQWHFYSSAAVDLALWGGFYYQDAANFTVAMPVSHTFKFFELFGAPILSIGFSSAGVQLGCGIAPGVSVLLSPRFKLFFEWTLGVAPVLNSGSLGVKVYL